MFQIIHSAVGCATILPSDPHCGWYHSHQLTPLRSLLFPWARENRLWSPTVQITFAHFDGKQRAWRSVNVSHFTTPASPSLDKRSCKGDQFSVVLDPKEPDCYKIQATYDKDTQLTLNVTRSPNVPGWKLGTGSRGGISYFGSVKPEKQSSKGYMPDRDAGADGYAVHRFWPSASVTGVVRIGQTMLDLAGSSGIFIHAVQGRRPNLLASRWNFADFQSIPKSPEEDQVSLIMMEFTTTAQHKHAKVNAGSIVVNGELVAVTMGGPPQVTDGNKAEHQDLALDKDTGYNAPKTVSFEWSGPAIADPSKTVKANIKLDATQGLAEKVDVLAEIPYFIKKVVNVVSGAKPYVYQVGLFTRSLSPSRTRS